MTGYCAQTYQQLHDVEGNRAGVLHGDTGVRLAYLWGIRSASLRKLSSSYRLEHSLSQTTRRFPIPVVPLLALGVLCIGWLFLAQIADRAHQPVPIAVVHADGLILDTVMNGVAECGVLAPFREERDAVLFGPVRELDREARERSQYAVEGVEHLMEGVPVAESGVRATSP